MAPLGPKALAKLSLGKSALLNVSWGGAPTLLKIPPPWHHVDIPKEGDRSNAVAYGPPRLMGHVDHHAGSSTGCPFTKRNSGVVVTGTLAPFHLQGIYSNGMMHK